MRAMAVATFMTLAFAACSPDDANEPRADRSPVPAPSPRDTSYQPSAIADKQALARSVARTLAAMLSNRAYSSVESYTRDFQNRTGCIIESSDVAFKAGTSEAVEQKARRELIRDVQANPRIDGYAHAQVPVPEGVSIDPTIGEVGGDADFIGVVVALTCEKT